jgi:hypothetical protein
LEKGWLLEELAGYMQLTDPMRAQKVIARARELNSGVIKPDVSPPTKPIKGPAIQAAAVTAFLKENYTDAKTLRLSFGALFDNIVWGVEETALLAEEQVKQLGLHLGFASTRPDREDYDGGPDNSCGDSTRPPTPSSN